MKLIGIVFVLMISNTSLAMEKKWLKLGNHTIHVEVAESSQDQAKGLMFRDHMSDSEGMMFVYPVEKPLGFWMKNTKIPLSIGFFTKDKLLVQVLEMSVPSVLESEPPVYQSHSPVMYALEMNKSWFEKNKLVVGRDKFSWINRPNINKK